MFGSRASCSSNSPSDCDGTFGMALLLPSFSPLPGPVAVCPVVVVADPVVVTPPDASLADASTVDCTVDVVAGFGVDVFAA